MKEPVKNADKFSLRKKYQNFTYALSGLRTFACEEHNIWLYILGISFSVALGFLFNIDRYEWLSQSVVTSLICSAELMNTAVENAVDLASPKYHTLAKKAKDMAAAAVLLAASGAFIVFLIIYLPKFCILL
ncbi:diacylglycerol kinase family protein [Bacteroidetes bacterium endosymbiont of Geopemphigus sp.]|uniref:diacylglycerol kinase family protein n=1 Tax=Bacteroidetes bacterium endosymbiont of Geopemphigus sp. TaxID=2047937 RepID=UPI000CD21552|nr:diacylglycerol kinase family protein [Bacteroidetes bacterium endosymbiont of Geopemphigus sp.]